MLILQALIKTKTLHLGDIMKEETKRLIIISIVFTIIIVVSMALNHFVFKLPNLCGPYGTPCNLTGW